MQSEKVSPLSGLFYTQPARLKSQFITWALRQKNIQSIKLIDTC